MTLAIGWPHEVGENLRTWPHEGGVWHFRIVRSLRSPSLASKPSASRWSNGGQWPAVLQAHRASLKRGHGAPFRSLKGPPALTPPPANETPDVRRNSARSSFGTMQGHHSFRAHFRARSKPWIRGEPGGRNAAGFPASKENAAGDRKKP